MTRIRPGDLVRIGTDAPLTAEVIATSREGQRRGRLSVRPVCRPRAAPVPVAVRDVVAHWRKVGGRNRADSSEKRSPSQEG